MDPKSTTLDPKLKEVYDRVMGTSAGVTPPPSTPPPPVVNPAPQVVVVAPAASTPAPSTPGEPHASAFPPPKSSLDASSAPKSAVDYAALAAKYATPALPITETPASPSLGGGLPPLPTHSDSAQQATNAAVHAPSAKPDPAVATFSATVQVPTNSSVPTAKDSSSLLKIALIVGVPLFLVAYTVVWMVVFKVDITKFIPGA